jgi:tRNA pseudouridine(54/55) synthase
VCPRCCLRFCGVPARDGTYTEHAPRGTQLHALVLPDQAADTDSSPAAPEHTCPACLGALQHVDVAENSANVSETQGLAQCAGNTPGSGPGRCRLVSGRLSSTSLAAAVQCGGHGDAAERYTLGVSLDPGFACLAASQRAALERDVTQADGSVEDVRVTALRDVLQAVFACRSQPTQPSLLPPVNMHVTVCNATVHSAMIAATGCEPLPAGGNTAQRRRGGASWRNKSKSCRTDDGPKEEAECTENGPLPVPAPHAQQAADDAYNSTAKRLAQLSSADLLQRVPTPFSVGSHDVGELSITVTVSRPMAYVGGYYIKHLRGISQTLWLAGATGGFGGWDDYNIEEVGNGSVSGHIEFALSALLRCDSFNFIAAGREDMDVRMLGPKGRPFVLEVTNARCTALDVTPESLASAVLASLGSSGHTVGCHALQLISFQQRKIMREGEAEKRKRYKALIWLSRPLAPDVLDAASRAVVDLQVQQATPVRVLHRRSLLVRTKTVHCMRVRPLPGAPCFCILHLDCSAGTYVKEFVHSDFGRTKPSLADVLLDAEAALSPPPGGTGRPRLVADCVQLDVEHIDMEWL